MLTKEQVKTISPKLAKNEKWHEYVDWFWLRPEWRKDYDALARGFEMGSRR